MFERYKTNSKDRLLIGNEDLFLIWGQNGLISVLILIGYLSVSIFDIGSKKAVVARYYVLLVRNGFFIFFIKLQLITFTELGSHNIVREQPYYLRISYALSFIFTSLINIDLIRGWVIVRRGYTH